MNKSNFKSLSALLIIGLLSMLSACKDTSKEKTTMKPVKETTKETVYASDVIPFFDQMSQENVILRYNSHYTLLFIYLLRKCNKVNFR